MNLLSGAGIMEAFFFFKKMCENFVGTLDFVRNREESVLYREVPVPRGSTVFF